MPSLNWGAFEQLSGGVQSNFEMLCRALIRRNYGRFGDFVARAAQPGVEFHLKLRMPCNLGDPGRWYGWQCRWYDLPSGKTLGTTRRTKIKGAITTTEKELPGLTDWVLWTRRPLTKSDQEWYYGLGTHMRLHLWTANDIEDHLSGDAEILRGTYFGELVLTPDLLASLHTSAVAPILRRWQPEVHQAVDAERALRRMLGEAATWDVLREVANQLEADAAAVEAVLSSLVGPLADVTVEGVSFARDVAAALANAHTALGRGDLDLLRQQLATRPPLPDSELASLPRRLRAKRERTAPIMTNTLADIRLGRRLLDKLDSHLGTGLIAILADAGCGKTELAAQITASDGNRPAGILLHGRDLHAGHGLNDLAHGVVIQGTPVRSIEALVAAVDAAGQRAHRRLPIVIDGLNEAEDPRDWKSPLASLDELLRHYPYVLVVCTLRTAFADETLPAHLSHLEIPDFGHDTKDAIRRYFTYYRINAADAELPMELLSHPLTLRLFCEVTNPERKREVGIEAMPQSLTALFDRYLEQAAERIAWLAPRSLRYYAMDVRTALGEIGTALWKEKTRSLDLAELRCRLGDRARPWNESIVRALEQDGVLLRIPGDTPSTTRVTAVYDALAGHLLADAVLSRQGRIGFRDWLRNPATVTALAGPLPDRHPLASDTLDALTGLVPRRLYGEQLWHLLDEPLRSVALHGAAKLEAAYLDSVTVEALATLISQPQAGQRDLFDRLWQTRGSAGHPLNADFLDAILRPMPVAERDLRWTEWVRRRQDKLLIDLQRLETRWRTAAERSSADRLRAKWVMWMLTSTVRALRDQATRALYWFGRGDSDSLFELTLKALAINDPYVPERLLGASYGVAMAHQVPQTEFGRSLSVFLTGLRDALIGSSAIHPTSHWLGRLYIRGIVTLALAYYTDAVPMGLTVDGHIHFVPSSTVEAIASNDPRAKEVSQTLQIDFENYTLGRLFDDRDNYDMKHRGHQDAVAHVRGTVWWLGWRESGLGVIDNDLTHYRSRGDAPSTERYGKKYGWIGFYTYVGILDDSGQLSRDDERPSHVNIDPSFPEPPLLAPINLPNWARPTPADDRRWIREGLIIVPDELLYRPSIGSYPGPWIAVSGDLVTDNQAPGRQVFGLLSALLIAAKDVDRLVQELSTREHPGRWWLPEVPSANYTFAGEIPWHPEFGGREVTEKFAELYNKSVWVEGYSPIEAEIFAHRYSWESYHSTLNKAGGTLVPSKSFSAKFDLRGLPQSFDQALPDGTTAAVSLGAPSGFNGNLLYLREDLVHQYAAGRRLILFIWGERQLLYPHMANYPDWLNKAREDHTDVWRLIRRGEDLSHAFASKPKRRSRR